MTAVEIINSALATITREVVYRRGDETWSATEIAATLVEVDDGLRVRVSVNGSTTRAQAAELVRACIAAINAGLRAAGVKFGWRKMDGGYTRTTYFENMNTQCATSVYAVLVLL